jgi:hypothetical protein
MTLNRLFETDVYFNHSIQDLVYIKSTLPPAFKIRHPGAKFNSFCIKTQMGFVICQPVLKSAISHEYQYLLVMKDGKEETGYPEEKKIAAVYRAFRITHILSEDELIDRII